MNTYQIILIVWFFIRMLISLYKISKDGFYDITDFGYIIGTILNYVIVCWLIYMAGK